MNKAKFCKNCGKPVHETPYITGPKLMHYNPSHSNWREDTWGCGNGTVAELGEEVEYDYLPPSRVDVPRRVIILSDEDILNNRYEEITMVREIEEDMPENEEEWDQEIAIEVRTPVKSMTLSKFIKGKKPEDVRDAVRSLMSDVHAVYGLDH